MMLTNKLNMNLVLLKYTTRLNRIVGKSGSNFFVCNAKEVVSCGCIWQKSLFGTISEK